MSKHRNGRAPWLVHACPSYLTSLCQHGRLGTMCPLNMAWGLMMYLPDGQHDSRTDDISWWPTIQIEHKWCNSPTNNSATQWVIWRLNIIWWSWLTSLPNSVVPSPTPTWQCHHQWQFTSTTTNINSTVPSLMPPWPVMWLEGSRSTSLASGLTRRLLEYLSN
jgi:hypothetical protein